MAKAQMLIRRPAAEVFEAFVDPAITSRFWFTKSSGRLAPGETVRWEWEMYGPEAKAQVVVKAVEPNRRILIEWDGYGMTPVEWIFAPQGEGATFVTITNSGFGGSEAEAVKAAVESTEGFALVLAGLKAHLEHGLDLNLIADHAPEAVVSGWEGRQ